MTVVKTVMYVCMYVCTEYEVEGSRPRGRKLRNWKLEEDMERGCAKRFAKHVI